MSFQLYSRFLLPAAICWAMSCIAWTCIACLPRTLLAQQDGILDVTAEATAGEESTEEDTSNPAPLTEEQLNNVERLYQQLDSDSFQLREQATRELIEQGPGIVGVLQGLKQSSTSPEVIARCTLVLDSIQRSGLPVRIDSFMRNPADSDTHRFFGWSDFSKVAGTSRFARRLFVDLLPRHSRLCNEQLSDEALVDVQDALVKMLDADLKAFNETTVADAVAMQYVMIRLQDRSSEELERIAGRLVSFAPYSSELNSAQVSKTLKRLTGQWITSVQRDATRPLLVSLHYGIPEGVELARKVLKAGTGDEVIYNVAMQTLMVYGDATDLPTAESYFQNDRIVFRESVFSEGRIIESTQQFRDLALAIAVHLRGFTMTDYFPEAQPHHLRVFNPQTLRFVGADIEATRVAAFEKYRSAISR